MTGQNRLCVYCCTETATTVDHIPPRGFFGRPYPDNLWTVPACSRCNNSFAKDDEYARAVISIDPRVQGATVLGNLSAIIRSLERPQSKGFANYLNSQIAPTSILGPDGTPFGWTVHAESARVNSTGERMIRGLFYLESGRPLGPLARIQIGSKMGVERRDPAIEHFAAALRKIPDQRSKTLEDTFGYVAAFHPAGSIWLLLLYGTFSWMAKVDNVDSEQAPTTAH